MNSITLTPARIALVAFLSLFGSACIATAHAASPFEGMVRRPVQEQFWQSCGEDRCEVTLTYTETIRGLELKTVEVESFKLLKGSILASKVGRKVVSADGFMAGGSWYSFDAQAKKLVQIAAPTAVASTR